MNELIARKLAEIKSANERIEAEKASIRLIEEAIGETLKAEGWHYHDSIEGNYDECYGWAAWLHPSVPLDGREPEDKSLMLLYKYPDTSMQVYG